LYLRNIEGKDKLNVLMKYQTGPQVTCPCSPANASHFSSPHLFASMQVGESGLSRFVPHDISQREFTSKILIKSIKITIL